MNSPQEAPTLACADAWFAANVQRCPRSAEWKHGARAGCFKAHGLAFERSPWPSGTAQDDAWGSGNLVGAAEWKWRAERGQLPGQPGWWEQA